MNVAVIGTGYVGLVTGTCLAETGNRVVCVDNDPAKLGRLKSAEVTIYEPGLEVLFHRNIEKKRLSFTKDLHEAVFPAEVVFLCLPTPQGENGAADLRYVVGVSKDLGSILSGETPPKYRIIVNKSTVPVGTVKRVQAILAEAGVPGVDVISNPEFLREGFAVEDFMKPDRIVIGTGSQRARQVMERLYEPFVRQGNPIIEMDTTSAEVTKYAANSYLAMRISFMNELANYCESVGADVDLVRGGMGSDSRIGKRFLFPGIGYGGSCFPKDVNALLKSAIDAGSPLKILSAVDEVNKLQKQVLVKKLLRHFPDGLRGKRLAIWGLAFKPNTDDVREAPSFVVINALLEAGATVAAYDPAAVENARKQFGESIAYADNEYDVVKSADALLILTEWNEFRNIDFARLRGTMAHPVIFDGRNLFRPEELKEQGFTYYSIGRLPVGV